MTSRERFQFALSGCPVDRPLFEPAVYEHKAALIGAPVSDLARSQELLVEAVLREVGLYDADAVTIGVDVYNVEAEAFGCEVSYNVGRGELPHMISPILESLSEVGCLHTPNPEADGRMPLMLQVAERVNREVGATKIVRGAVSGPFSLASELLGGERLLMALVEDPEGVRALLRVTARVSLEYGLAFLRRGALPVYFDSRSVPPLVSPDQYRELILPLHRQIVAETKAAGGIGAPIIIGGNTTPIAVDLASTGADYLLCDYTADFATYRSILGARNALLRRNLDPGLLLRGDVARIREESARYLREAGAWPGFVLGTGIVPWGAPPESVLAVKEVVDG